MRAQVFRSGMYIMLVRGLWAPASQSLPPCQVGQAKTSCPSAVKTTSAFSVTAPVAAVDAADHVLRDGGRRPEELAGLAVQRIDHAGLAGDAGWSPPSAPRRSNARVDPAHFGRVGRHRGVDEDALEGMVEVPNAGTA